MKTSTTSTRTRDILIDALAGLIVLALVAGLLASWAASRHVKTAPTHHGAKP